jgi:pimeloyl-ACP methyl ester carboxylesterase
MKKLFFLVFVLLSCNISYSQVGNSPYPVIFVHGLNSDDRTWNNTITQLSASWELSSNHVLSAVINARGGDTTDYLQDVIIPLLDVNGNIVNRITSSSIYAINFGNFWNRNNSDPRIILYNNTTPGSNQSPSNQSAIYKQGYALKILIDSVLRVTGASKVILAGHSMGGLGIREYLQRKENGIHKWWIDPNDSINGHKVAKVITIGTPHLGTDVSIPIPNIDFKSEAIRDMRNSFTSNGSDAAYLFGNLESNVPSSYYNKDINCNGISTDTVNGLDSNSSDNSIISLPKNIQYTWILSNYLGLGTDLAVALSSQAIYNDSAFVPLGVTDTLLTNKNHIQETGDTRSMIRALDEPDYRSFAYDISFGKLYSGFITLQSNGKTSDSDFFKVQTLSGGRITVNLKSLNSGVTSISLLSDSGITLTSKNITASPDSISFYSTKGNYFIRIIGNSLQNPNLNSYNFTANIIPASVLNITLGIEGMWNGSMQVQDTLKLFLTNDSSPYNNIDSAIVYLNSSGNATADFIHAPSGNYYIRVIHRNALETWTSSPVSFMNGLTIAYDFTTSQSRAFGNNQTLKSGRWCVFSGDVNHDGIIDVSDESIIDNDVYNVTTGFVNSDLTGDLIVDVTDAAIADNNGYNYVSVIKP